MILSDHENKTRAESPPRSSSSWREGGPMLVALDRAFGAQRLLHAGGRRGGACGSACGRVRARSRAHFRGGRRPCSPRCFPVVPWSGGARSLSRSRARAGQCLEVHGAARPCFPVSGVSSFGPRRPLRAPRCVRRSAPSRLLIEAAAGARGRQRGGACRSSGSWGLRKALVLVCVLTAVVLDALVPAGLPGVRPVAAWCSTRPRSRGRARSLLEVVGGGRRSCFSASGVSSFGARRPLLARGLVGARGSSWLLFEESGDGSGS